MHTTSRLVGNCRGRRVRSRAKLVRSQAKAADNHRFFATRVAVELLHMDFHYFRRSLASECTSRRRRRSEMARVHKTLQLRLLFPLVVVVAKGRAGRSGGGGWRSLRAQKPGKSKSTRVQFNEPFAVRQIVVKRSFAHQHQCERSSASVPRRLWKN